MRSLCETCANVREVVTPRGSRFLLCQLSGTDPTFPKYPAQPVMRCDGYQPGETGPGAFLRVPRLAQVPRRTLREAAAGDTAVHVQPAHDRPCAAGRTAGRDHRPPGTTLVVPGRAGIASVGKAYAVGVTELMPGNVLNSRHGSSGQARS